MGGENSRDHAFSATARSLPLLENDTAALTLAFYYSFARHPHIRMLLIMPLCLGLFFLFMYRAGAYGGQLAGETAWIPMAALAWPFFNFSLFLFNVFGVDAQSFQGLMLLPVQRRKYLIAKNIALAPFVLGLSLFFVATGALLVQAPLRVIALSLILAAHLYLFFSVVGNYLSVGFPYRINRDALRQPTRRLRMVIVGVASTALATLMILPATCCMLAERFLSVHPDIMVRNAGILSAAALLVSSLAAYMVGLSVFGDQFTEREHRIYLRISGDRE
ncbi:MAG TPA: hypothetical protein ENN29_11595 [Candidatus Hydrogenedentes bacterium]|nr:hypothetical protein [Candidatus Hydrogenedentota bacterium]